ncbi:hypothetical protein HBI56_162150 [Parastagonospora nodorum]|uniref:Uncharacterized protein n=1 Tax=Phaeosphaeria nodorum (strain SN15 / ATCC MYA-4574 / FGSC 10173) TaxID=321614 RepID=A0A7U2I9V0_PHANO|nr:hypothetical protein HBH56_210490 [Parastagonospora nodorum]QRD05943.1 hypothetical protein JI435_422960 [Parastagonospora nodorum SN15]KAH3931594.1 hypothetical protein HBH54_099100 [Parastagonospora nodorum]KAH3944374.1 hypothetical protein HBH53_160560 [Parastagonospora nodorum]KAH3960711.1 hypothetical protein HBH51_188850 [Parastagonospora nodorum]
MSRSLLPWKCMLWQNRTIHLSATCVLLSTLLNQQTHSFALCTARPMDSTWPYASNDTARTS